MPFAEFFARFGIFSKRDFLTLEQCGSISCEMQTVASQPGMVWNRHDGDHVSEDVKKRKELNVSARTDRMVRDLLLAQIEPLSSHFATSLTDLQPLKFTRYDVGDFYAMHRDISGEPSASPTLHDRKVAITIFLNQEGEAEGDGDYVGGNLTFYGLVADDGWDSVGLPIESDAGMLVAFRPDTIHEVTPVTHGSRYAITTWFT